LIILAKDDRKRQIMRLFYGIVFLITTQLFSQNKTDKILYDVHKVFVQLNELKNPTLVASSDEFLLFNGKNNFSIWSARDKRKMYEFSIDGSDIKALFTSNSKNILFFIKREGNETLFAGNLNVKSGIYQENEISNKDFTPLNFKATFKFDTENKNLFIYANNKLWNFNIETFKLEEMISFDKNLERNYIDFLSISEKTICFKIESDIKTRYFVSQLRPAEWKLDSVMLFDKTTKNLSKVNLKDNAIGAYTHLENKIVVDYQDRISLVNIFDLEEKNYPKNKNYRVYKTSKEKENTLIILGEKELEKEKNIKYDSLYNAFKKSKEDNFDLYLYSRKLSPYNLLYIDKIDENSTYKKGTFALPIKSSSNPCQEYLSTNFGLHYNRNNGIFSYYPAIEKSQRWNLDYTRETLEIFEGLTVNNKGDFTFYGYDGLEVMNIVDEKEIKRKPNFELKRLFYLQNQNILEGFIKEEKNKKLVQIVLKDSNNEILWKPELIDAKIKEEINVTISLNHTQTQAFLNISPLYYDENNKSYSFLIDLEKQEISKSKEQNGAYFTENYSYINSLGDYFMMYTNFSKKEQTIQNNAFLATLKNDNIIYKDNTKEGVVLKGEVKENGIIENFAYNLPNKDKFQFNASPFSFINSKNLLSGVHQKELLFWKLDDENPVKSVPLNYDSATYLTNSEKQLFVYYKNGFIDVIDLESFEIVSTFTIHKQNDVVYKAFFNDDLKFFIPKEIIKEYHFVKGFESFPLANYELFLNRPDVILSKLGYTSPELVEVYKKAHLKRLENSGYSETTDFLSIKKPKLILANRNDIQPISNTNSLSLNFKAEEHLDSLVIYINGVPILKNKPLKNVFQEAVTLSNGLNKIAVFGINKEGIQSESINLEVTFNNDQKPTIHYFGIGVSKYADASMNLKFADKDVRSLAKVFNTKFEGRIKIDTLNNANATKENILAFKTKLANTNINDIVIVSFSGHGLVDEANDFYFATHNIDFNEPEINGLAYSEIQKLVENIPARKKLLLIDACHSGELDAEEIKETVEKLENVTAYLPEGAKGTITDTKKSGFKTSFEIMKSSFNNTDRGNGAFVISAAGGKEYAFESKDWGNGVFTYSFINALNDLKVDKYNNEQAITISMLKDYIYKNVKKLTNNKQKPTSRADNLELDWILID
tara:strand:- start:2246 stop:5737 length:3492 start_codon:yes stop_codon:yes gene_type:complete